MKINVVNKKEKKFEPIKLELTVESMDDLLSLWHRFNIELSTIKDSYKNVSRTPIPISDKTFFIWKAIDELVKENK